VNYYNEIEPFAAAWIRNLIASELIPPGYVDTRSIKEVTPNDIQGYTQCHFFAGVAGWSLALQIAGVAATKPLWTGSCPCQPYSAAGKGEGDNDPRNLWPDFFRLIRKCRPECVIGEQVENAIGHGWLDGVSADLEGEGYAVGAIVLGAHSVGAPHIRQRLYWGGKRLGNADSIGQDTLRGVSSEHRANAARSANRMGDASSTRLQERPDGGRATADIQRQAIERASPWSNYLIIPCRDNKARRISSQSGDEPLATGIPRDLGRGESKLRRMAIRAARANRVGRLKGYGNAIVPEVAAEFIRAFMEANQCQNPT